MNSQVNMNIQSLYGSNTHLLGECHGKMYLLYLIMNLRTDKIITNQGIEYYPYLNMLIIGNSLVHILRPIYMTILQDYLLNAK